MRFDSRVFAAIEGNRAFFSTKGFMNLYPMIYFFVASQTLFDVSILTFIWLIYISAFQN